MKLTRRSLIGTGAAALALAGAPRLWANTRLTLGSLQIDTLNDGNLVLPGSFALDGVPQEEAMAILAAHGQSTEEFTPPCNLTLLRDGERVVLFDAGSGAHFMPTAGRILDAFDALGVDPGEVTHVVFTHAHPDHLWGVLDDFDEPLFAGAAYLMGRAEHDYWMDPATVDTIGAERQAFAAGALRHIGAIEDRLSLFEDGAEILPGVTARMTPGHTPGHMSFVLTGGAESAMVVGDAIGNHHIAFARPEWPSPSDQEPDQGAATRVALIAELAEGGMPLIGFHLPGAIGRVEAADTGYGFAVIEG